MRPESRLNYGALILIVTLALSSCEAGAPPFKPAIAGASWTIAYSPSMPAEMSRQKGDYVFDFPTFTDGVRYLIERAPKVRMGQTITMVFRLQGRGRLLPTQGNPPAKVRLFMQRTGDKLTAQEPYKRWWSTANVELKSPGEFTLSAKIEPNEWSSVFGANGSTVPVEFSDCVANLAHLGFTFGGNFAGHGVYVTDGSVRFVLRQYQVDE